MKRLGVWVFVGLIVAMVPSALFAGTVVDFEIVAYDANVENGTGTMYIEGDMARIEMTTGEDSEIIIYRGDKKVIWAVHTEKGVYVEMTPDKVSKAKAQIRDQIEQFDKFLEGQSREQREAMEAQFGAQVAEGRKMIEEKDKSKMRYKMVKKDVEIGEWKTKKYKQYYKDEFDDVEYWVADWDKVNAKRADFAVCDQIEQDFGLFGESFTMVGSMWNDEAEEPIDGFPVQFMYYSNGSKMMRANIKDVRQEDVEAKRFDLPEGLELQPFMDTE